MRPLPRYIHARLLAAAVCATLLAACADSSEPAGPDRLPDDTPTRGTRRVVLDSLFGPSGAAVDAALATEDSVARRELRLWLDSLVAALPVPDVGRAAPAGGPALARIATTGDGTASRTVQRERVVTTPERTLRLRIDRTYEVSAGERGVDIEAHESELTFAVAADGETPLPDAPAYLWDATRKLSILPCPQLEGKSQGTWSSRHVVYGSLTAAGLPDASNSEFQFTESLKGSIDVQLDDAATRVSFDDRLTHALEHRFYDDRMVGSAYSERRERPMSALFSAVSRGALRQVTGDYDRLTASSEVGGIDVLLVEYALDTDRGFRLAERVWRSGICIEVQEPGGAVQPASPNAALTLRPFPVSRLSTNRVSGGTIDAQARGGSISPAASPVRDPASFRYTASATGEGQVEFRSVSKLGVGYGTVVFTAVDAGSIFEYQSTTQYAIDSRDPMTPEETVTGTLLGTQSLRSRLTLVPIEPTEPGARSFAIVATTIVQVDATGQVRARQQGAQFPYSGDASFRITANDSSRNPAFSGAPEFDQVGPDQFLITTDTAGILTLFRIDGQDYYGIELALSGVPAQYDHSVARTAVCGPDPQSTLTGRYNNTSRRYSEDGRDPGSCWPGGVGSDFTRDLPLGFGAIGLHRTAPDPATGRSDMFLGRWTPSTGVVEGSETRTVTGCVPVRAKDPLQLGSVLTSFPVWTGDLMFEQGTCSLQYTARWRLFVPAR